MSAARGRRPVRRAVVGAGAALLLANGACALGGIVSWGEPDHSYAGYGAMLLGAVVFLGAVPAGILAIIALVRYDAEPARVRRIALLAVAVGAVGVFWLLAAGGVLMGPDTARTKAVGIALFLTGAAASAALLLHRAPPAS